MEVAAITCPKCKNGHLVQVQTIRELVENDKPAPECPECQSEAIKHLEAFRNLHKYERVLLVLSTYPLPVDEWTFTIAAWQANKAIFGLPGHHEKYPSEKRIYIELVKLVGRKLAVRAMANHYIATNSGMKLAKDIKARIGQK